MDNKTFRPDPGKAKFSITFHVFENCQRTSITKEDGVADPTYFEVLGVLAHQTMAMMTDQIVRNREEWIKRAEDATKSATPKKKKVK